MLKIKKCTKLSKDGIFSKYISGPIVSEKSITSADEIEQPVFYVCRDSQFDFHKSRILGIILDKIHYIS